MGNNMKNPTITFIAAPLIAMLFFLNTAEARTVNEHVYIVPVGQIDKKLIAEIKERLPKSFPISIKATLDEHREVPEDAYEPSRKQYVAQLVLDRIMQQVGIDVRNERALIITDVDLYMPDLDFVFGLADAKKGACIISLARLGNGERALKESAHELAHSWGLEHCPKPACVMHFSNNLQDVDNKKSTFCRECRDFLRQRYHKSLFKAPLKPLL